MSLSYEEVAQIIKMIDNSNCDEVNIEIDGIKILEYASFEIISNKKYWFRVQKPLIEILDNNKKYWFSIYGENICCLELFKIYTNLSVITCDEYIKNISSPYKVFKP